MADIIVRRLDDKVKERLRARAKRHGRSLEAEAREILLEAASTSNIDDAEPEFIGLGTLMRQRFGKKGLTKAEARKFNDAIEELRRSSKPRDPGFR